MKVARPVSVLLIALGSLVAATGSAAAASVGMVSPGCDVGAAERLDWATKRDTLDHPGSPKDDPGDVLRRVYTALRLCDGDVVYQSGMALHGPKDPGVAPPDSFQPQGRSWDVARRGGKAGRISCTNTAYDPQFVSAQVRAGGRSACTTSGSLTATTCVGRYFQSSGTSDQTACTGGSTYGSAITIYTPYIACYDVVSYRTNFYGATGNAYSLYYNGLYNGCL